MTRPAPSLALAALLLASGAVRAAEPAPTMDPASCPLHAQHMAAAAQARAADHEHAQAKMDARGEQAMGFSQTATTHHFVITADGGEIRVEANTASDIASRDQIRAHLSVIARAFAAGDFSIPELVHATVPAGATTLTRLHAEVRYAYEDLPQGGRVTLRTENQAALEAIHDFLRFQIEEHRTGDPEAPVS